MSGHASSRFMPTKPCVCMGLTNRIERPLTGCRVTAGHCTSSYFLSVTPLSTPYRRSPAGPLVRPCRPVSRPSGEPMPNPSVLWDIESDPVLAGTKLIAGAWDAGGLYQVGSFVGDSWQEWNGRAPGGRPVHDQRQS